MPIVSVIIPTFNTEQYIAEAIESVLNQSYQDYEVIVVDDGSTDDTPSVLDAYLDRIRYFYKQNGGPASARNLGIRHAQGEYIAFLDADDLWFPHKLETQLKVFEDSPGIGLVHSSRIYFDDRNREPERIRARAEQYNSEDAFPYLFLRNFIGNSTVIVRKTCFEEVGLFDESPEFLGTEDYDMWLRISYRYPIGYVSTPLSKYRVREGQLSKNIEKACLNERNVIEKAIRIFPDIERKISISVADRFARLTCEYGCDYLAVGELTRAREKFLESLRYQCTLKNLIYYSLTFFGNPLTALKRLRGSLPVKILKMNGR